MNLNDAENHALKKASGSAELNVSLMNEDSALALLRDAGTSSEVLAQMARNPIVAKSRKLLLGLVEHSRTPRHISVPLLRRMFTFDLVQVTLLPAVAADLKRAAEEQIIVRLESIPAGEKITLARRASGRIAAALLQENDSRILAPALDNPQLTEALIVQGLMKRDAPEHLFVLVSNHAKWSLRREAQIALLGSEKTPPDKAAEFGKNFSAEFLRQIRSEREEV